MTGRADLNFSRPLDIKLLNIPPQGTWAAQSVKHLTIGFSSGHDLTVLEFKPHIGLCADSVEPAWDSLSPLSLCPSHLALSFSQK